MAKVVLSYNGDDGKVYSEDLNISIIPRVNETVKIITAAVERNYTVTGVHHDYNHMGQNHEITIFANKQK